MPMPAAPTNARVVNPALARLVKRALPEQLNVDQC